MEKFKTYWWESQSSMQRACPPELSQRPELQEDDLFLHRYAADTDPQIWVWTRQGSRPRWKLVRVGYIRPSDGRVLALTEVHKKPSWLEPGWHAKRKKQSESLYGPSLPRVEVVLIGLPQIACNCNLLHTLNHTGSQSASSISAAPASNIPQLAALLDSTIAPSHSLHLEGLLFLCSHAWSL